MCFFCLFSVAKDLAKLTNHKSQIRRRHSITLCETRHRKSSTESTASSTASTASPRSSPPREDQFASLNVAAIQAANNEQEDSYEEAPKTLKTLDLRLEEVAHIRSVMTKVELEAMPLDSSLRDNVARGKVA
jgi:hypothetical protein